MKFAIRQKDKAIHLDIKKKMNVTLLHWKGEFLALLGVTNTQTGLMAHMNLWAATSQLHQVVIPSLLPKTVVVNAGPKGN